MALTKNGFECTDEDLSAGGYVAQRDPSMRHEPTAEEGEHLRAIARGVHALRKLGWRQIMYAPKDSSRMLLVEPGSSGIHEGYRDEISFWICDGDVWPSDPILWKAKP